MTLISVIGSPYKEDYYTSGQGYRSIRSTGINRALQAIATIAALTPQCDDQYAG